MRVRCDPLSSVTGPHRRASIGQRGRPLSAECVPDLTPGWPPGPRGRHTAKEPPPLHGLQVQPSPCALQGDQLQSLPRTLGPPVPQCPHVTDADSASKQSRADSAASRPLHMRCFKYTPGFHCWCVCDSFPTQTAHKSHLIREGNPFLVPVALPSRCSKQICCNRPSVLALLVH